MRLTRPAVALLLVALAFTGCRRHDRDVVRASTTRPDSLGPGDLRIYNEDSTVDMVLVGDHVSAGLSDRVVADVRRKTESASTTDSGLGGAIASIVNRTVSSAIGTRVEIPLSQVKDVRYDHGALMFDWKDGRKRELFTNTRANGERTDKAFSEADAQRFIDAVRARKRELGN